VLLEERWNEAVRNLSASFETRLVRDSLADEGLSEGSFYAAVGGDKLGNFDVVFDPRAPQQITIGRVVVQDNASTFDTWTSFQGRSFRNKTRTIPEEEFRLSNYRLEASLEPDLA